MISRQNPIAMHWSKLILLFLVNGSHLNISAFSLKNLTVPHVVDYRDRVKLTCSYDMGSHKLNSVKWYKDDLEFFRYSPMMHPIYLTFPVTGVTISNQKFFCDQYICNIELENLQRKSTGSYRCEVSGDAPEFKLISQTANMTVSALPKVDPIIHGVTKYFRFDDFVVANCTSDWSSPPATLSWYINDERAPPDLLQPQQETTMNSNGYILHSRSLEIRFHIDKSRFINSRGVLKMKCSAEIPQLPFLLRETTATASILSKYDLNNQKLIIENRSDQQHVPFESIILLLILQFSSIFYNGKNFKKILR